MDFPTQHDFCYTARYLQQLQTVPQDDVHATAAALLHAVQELEADKDAQSIQETNQDSGGRPVRKYFIKRNYSGVHNSLCLASFELVDQVLASRCGSDTYWAGRGGGYQGGWHR